MEMKTQERSTNPKQIVRSFVLSFVLSFVRSFLSLSRTSSPRFRYPDKDGDYHVLFFVLFGNIFIFFFRTETIGRRIKKKKIQRADKRNHCSDSHDGKKIVMFTQ